MTATATDHWLNKNREIAGYQVVDFETIRATVYWARRSGCDRQFPIILSPGERWSRERWRRQRKRPSWVS